MNILLVLEIDSNRLKEASVTEAMYEYHLLQKIGVHNLAMQDKANKRTERTLAI